jgi:hypothetical protein
MIEPLRWFEANQPEARVLFLQPKVKRWVPIEYGGGQLSRVYVRNWTDLEPFAKATTTSNKFDFFVVYPKRADDLPRYIDSLQTYFGEVEPVFEIAPSGYDQALHKLNPGHNDNYAAFVFKPAATAQAAAVEILK